MSTIRNRPDRYDPRHPRTAIFVGLMFLTATATFLAGDQLVLGALAPTTAGEPQPALTHV